MANSLGGGRLSLLFAGSRRGKRPFLHKRETPRAPAPHAAPPRPSPPHVSQVSAPPPETACAAACLQSSAFRSCRSAFLRSLSSASRLHAWHARESPSSFSPSPGLRGVRFLSSKASEPFRELLSRLEEEGSREKLSETAVGSQQAAAAFGGPPQSRSQPAAPSVSSAASVSAAPPFSTQKELLRKLLLSFSAYYDRHFFYPGSPSSASRHPSASSPSPPSLSSSFSPASYASFAVQACASVSVALALFAFHLPLFLWSVWLFERRPASANTEEEAREAAHAFVRFRLFFATAANQVSFFTLIPSLSGDQEPLSHTTAAASSPPAQSPPSVSPLSLCADVWRLLAPSLFPTDVSLAASVLKASCLGLSAAVLQRTYGGARTVAGLLGASLGSSLFSLLAYQKLGISSLHVSGTDGALFFTSAMLLAAPGLRPQDGAGAKAGGAMRGASRKRVVSVLPRVPIAATALAVPVFFELALRAPEALESLLAADVSPARRGRDAAGGAEPYRAQQTQRREGTAAAGEAGAEAGREERGQGGRQSLSLAGETHTQTQRGAEGGAASASAREAATDPLQTLRVASRGDHSHGEVGFSPSSAESPSSFERASQLRDAGSVQERVLFEAALAAGAAAALERQRERGEMVSRELQRARLGAEEAAEEWERRWAALEIRDMRVVGDLFVFVLTLVGARLFRRAP
ncbi:hypothetical protein BESB_035250 [Besnoitia besnoiti]|uniref:Uncharacterized protein n=1 Tax=Besnoitia besnoiti TaxID=94643 RepID=A0A2A9MMP9_BESBE|nr:hypothetical protein BESB_035250 [Besnoitia besnoiti]PFH37067.1 hypothetical protein BESB_035250 [Besnoitia besnoiti]